MHSWVTTDRTHEGFPLYLRRPIDVDTADNRRGFPTLAVITHELRERLSDGRPDRDYNDSLADFDHDIITAFDADYIGVPVLVETFGGKRHYYFYVSPATDVGSIVSHIGASYPAEPLSWETRPDDKWAFLDRYAKDFFQDA
jgi:hypothetical protein